MEEVGVRAGMLVSSGSLFLQVMMNMFDVIPFAKVPVTCWVVLSFQC